MTKDEEECIKRLEIMNMKGNIKNGTCCFDGLSLLRLREVPTKEELRHAFTKIDEKMAEINGTPYMMTLSPSEFGTIVNVFLFLTVKAKIGKKYGRMTEKVLEIRRNIKAFVITICLDMHTT